MNKLNQLKDYIKSLGNVAVAFSSGVDSTFLLKVAHEVLGNNVVALTAKSPLFPKRELEEAEEFCQENGIRHIIVEIDIDKIKHNPQNRWKLQEQIILNMFWKVQILMIKVITVRECKQ